MFGRLLVVGVPAGLPLRFGTGVFGNVVIEPGVGVMGGCRGVKRWVRGRGVSPVADKADAGGVKPGVAGTISSSSSSSELSGAF